MRTTWHAGSHAIPIGISIEIPLPIIDNRMLFVQVPPSIAMLASITRTTTPAATAAIAAGIALLSVGVLAAGPASVSAATLRVAAGPPASAILTAGDAIDDNGGMRGVRRKPSRASLARAPRQQPCELTPTVSPGFPGLRLGSLGLDLGVQPRGCTVSLLGPLLRTTAPKGLRRPYLKGAMVEPGRSCPRGGIVSRGLSEWAHPPRTESTSQTTPCGSASNVPPRQSAPVSSEIALGESAGSGYKRA